MLRAYFDESGTHGDEAYVASIAGFVGTKEVWESLEGEWLHAISYYTERVGVRTFHAAHCLAEPPQGEFAGLDRFHCLAIVKLLSEALSRHDVHAVWSSVIVEDWLSNTTPEFRSRFPKPFDLCFEHIIIQLWEWANRTTGGEMVVPVFAIQNEYSARMEAIGRAYQVSDGYCRFLGPIAFGSPAQVIPLQAADLLAHEVSEYRRAAEYDELTLKSGGMRRILTNATAFNGLGVGGCFDSVALNLTVERLERTGSIFGKMPWDGELPSEGLARFHVKNPGRATSRERRGGGEIP